MEAQASRDWQHTIDQMKSDAERSKIAEQKRLQAQRDQWAKESREQQRRLKTNY